MADESTNIARPSRAAYGEAGTAIQRQGFGETQLEQRRELQSTALAERAKAEIQAMFIVALQRPRNLGDVRTRLLEHCRRPGFAQVAEYAKPIGGGKVRGPSIRFVESALQEYGNVRPTTTILYDDDEKRTVRVSVIDLERNVSYDEDIIVEKFVERRDAKGGEILGQRYNTSGDVVYRVRGTEDDIATKQGAAISKRIRTLGLRILPADLVAESMAVCAQTRQRKDAEDPAAARHAIFDAFSSIGVMPRQLDDYLGHSVAEASPAELDELRVAFATVRDGDSRWVDLVEAKRHERGEIEQPSKLADTASSRLHQRLQQQKARTSGKAPAGGEGSS